MGSKGYILGRLLQILVTLWIILTLLFFFFRLGLPDPTVALVSEGLSPEDRQIIIERFGLDKPLMTQYFIYLKNVFIGEFGTSFHYKAPIADVIGEKLLNTLVLMLPAILLSYIIGPLIGVLLTWKRGTKLEMSGITIGLFFRSAPMFWTGMLFVMLFGIHLGWLPTSGMRTLPYEAANFFDKIFTLDFLRHLILPMMVIFLYYTALPMLIMRNTMLETMGEDYIEFCRAKGISMKNVMYRHAARNALLPVVTQAAITAGFAVGGQVVVEVVFSWPGLGMEMLQAVRTSDYPLAQATFLLLAAMVLIMNFFADVLYSKLDPRVAYKRNT